MSLNDQDISVVLVDRNDEVIGYGDKIEVHRKGLLHRAFSIFLFNHRGELLLQRRADTKYHAGGLWANTCCGHPFPGEPVDAAASRRLFEELGYHGTLIPSIHIYYKTDLAHGMIEHEYVHVFKGRYDGSSIRPDPNEVQETQWIKVESLQQDIASDPYKYASWFTHYIEKYSALLFRPADLEGIS